MLDSFNRHINYLRISVTDRCNLRCIYCMPKEGIQCSGMNDLLSFEEITGVVRAGVEFGITKIRLTGGEPLVRRNLTKLVSMISDIPEIKDLSMTTNGILLEEFARDLKEAGLQRVNISLDTLDYEKFSRITRGGDLDKVLRGINAAQRVGLTPIKFNMVLNKYTTEEDIHDLREFARSKDYHLRFITEMDRERGLFWPVEGGDGGHCNKCNRLRLSSEGNIYPCLFNGMKYNVRDHGPRMAIMLAIREKPESGKGSELKKMCSIGG